MSAYKKIYFVSLLMMSQLIVNGQNIHHFFVQDIYQRSYFNPALNNSGKVMIASGLGLDFSTNGPAVSDFIVKKPEGGLLLSASSAINAMEPLNDVFGYSAVNTFDFSIQTPIGRISAGHAWKANGWMEYSKDLAELLTFGNGEFIGETIQIGPQIDYINYNEVYLGIQKDIGILSIGAKIKRLSGVEAIKTGNSKIELTTSDDIYQLTLASEYELNSSGAFSYTDINNFDLNVENFSFENFLSSNGGWAFDIGASANLGEKLELSLSILDIGGMDWDADPATYSSSTTQTFDGIDVSEYITSEEEFVILDSIESLLDLQETSTTFSTKLPTQIFLGGTFKLSDLWSFGAIVHSKGNGDRRENVLGLNATARLYKFLSAGVLYAIKNGQATNIGLHTSVKVGPVTGFLSTDSILKVGSLSSKNGTLRAGLSIKL